MNKTPIEIMAELMPEFYVLQSFFFSFCVYDKYLTMMLTIYNGMFFSFR